MCSHVNIFLSHFEIGTRARAFDDSLDDTLHSIPIIVGQRGHLHAEILRYLANHVKAAAAMNETDGNTDASKSSRAPNTVQIDLRVCVAATIVGKILKIVPSGLIK